MRDLRTESGVVLVFEQSLGAGQEAEVWSVRGRPQSAAKIYHPAVLARRGPELSSRLRIMASMPPRPAGVAPPSVAWPTELLYDDQGFAGFLMPRVTDATPIGTYQSREISARLHPNFVRANAMQAAIELSTSVEALHRAGHQVGNLDSGNVLCREKGSITLIDADSFQITAANGHIHPPAPVPPDYLPPEWHLSSGRPLAWRVEHDYFSLAVHLFQLLFQRHPFAGTPLVGRRQPSQHLQFLRKGIFPHLSNRAARPERDMRGKFDLLPALMREAFARAFVYGYARADLRTTADHWRQGRETVGRQLVGCERCGAWHAGNAAGCPLCTAGPPWLREFTEHARHFGERLVRYPLLTGGAVAVLIGGTIYSFAGTSRKLGPANPPRTPVRTPAPVVHPEVRPLPAPTASPSPRLRPTTTPSPTRTPPAESSRTPAPTPLAPRGKAIDFESLKVSPTPVPATTPRASRDRPETTKSPAPAKSPSPPKTGKAKPGPTPQKKKKD